MSVKNDINRVFSAGYLLLEMISLCLAFIFAHMFRGVSFSSTHHDKIFLYMGFICWILITGIVRSRRLFFTGFERLVAQVKAVFLFALALSLVAFVFKEADYSRLVVFYFVICHAVVVVVLHIAGDLYLLKTHRSQKMLRRCCIVGEDVDRLKHRLIAHPELGMLPVCSCSLDAVDSPELLQRSVSDCQVCEVVIRCSYAMVARVNALVNWCSERGVRVTILPQHDRLVEEVLTPGVLLGYPTLRVRELPLDNYYMKVIKRLFDMSFALAVLVVASPVLLLCAVFVKLSSKGPVFFKQARTGYNQREFMMLKFRSMKVTTVADSLQATKNDPRKTWVGEWLRRTNLDELPQFINVLRGDMSVVGPRPHMLAHTEEFSAVAHGYLGRHYVKPGITGWAQVNGWRGPTDTDEKIRGRVEHDLWYAENWTFKLDLKIIFMTLFSRTARENAF